MMHREIVYGDQQLEDPDLLLNRWHASWEELFFDLASKTARQDGATE